MIDFFKILFTKKSKIDPIKEEIKINSAVKYLDTEPLKPIIKKEEPIMSNIENIYLVVADSTGRTNIQTMDKKLQNFMFIYARDEAQAKDLFIAATLESLKRKNIRLPPAQMDQVMNELLAVTRATKLLYIIGNMSPQANFWSYIPSDGRVGIGQQATIRDFTALVNANENSLHNVGVGASLDEQELRKNEDELAKKLAANKPKQPVADVTALQQQVAQLTEMMTKMMSQQASTPNQTNN